MQVLSTLSRGVIADLPDIMIDVPMVRNVNALERLNRNPVAYLIENFMPFSTGIELLGSIFGRNISR